MKNTRMFINVNIIIVFVFLILIHHFDTGEKKNQDTKYDTFTHFFSIKKKKTITNNNDSFTSL